MEIHSQRLTIGDRQTDRIGTKTATYIMSLAEVIKNKNLSLFRPNDNFEFDKQDKSDYNYCCCREQIGLQAKTFTVDCLGHIMTIPVGRVGPGQCIRSVI